MLPLIVLITMNTTQIKIITAHNHVHKGLLVVVQNLCLTLVAWLNLVLENLAVWLFFNE